MPTSESDEVQDLIQRARRKEPGAMTALLEAHSRQLLESVRRELGDRLRQRLESQDVMQQVYVDALESIDQFQDRGRGSFLAWLRRIALNRICDEDRRAFQTMKRKGELRAADLNADASMASLFDRLSPSASTPSMAAQRADRARLLERALERLAEDQRWVIELRYLRQASVAETAELMGRTERAVRSLCARALIQLREHLGDVV